MSENEPKSINSRNEMPLTPARKVAYYTNLIAENHDLDGLTYEALSKYANTNFKIRQIATNFRGTTEKGIVCADYEDENGQQCKMVLTRESYSDMLKTMSTIAFNLYNTYLGKNGASRAAAREVQVIVNDIYPQSP